MITSPVISIFGFILLIIAIWGLLISKDTNDRIAFGFMAVLIQLILIGDGIVSRLDTLIQIILMTS